MAFEVLFEAEQQWQAFRRWAACYSGRTSPVYPATRRVASVHPSPVAIQVPATQALPHAACPLGPQYWAWWTVMSGMTVSMAYPAG